MERNENNFEGRKAVAESSASDAAGNAAAASTAGAVAPCRRWPRRVAIALVALVVAAVLAAAAFLVYASDYYRDADAAHENLASTSQLPVAQGAHYVAFGDPAAETGLVFYPGAKVEYTAYAPLMRDLAERGYLAVVVEMPFNFAFFGIDAADEVREAFPQVSEWWVGGHSLGGSMAAQYAADHAEDGAARGPRAAGRVHRERPFGQRLGRPRRVRLGGPGAQPRESSPTAPHSCPRVRGRSRSSAATTRASAPTVPRRATARPR